MNIASIDIGSNTVLLLIAKIEKSQLVPIINRYESPRLGKDLHIGGNIQTNRIENLYDILRSYNKEIIAHNCENIIVTATNAMRIAANSQEIIKNIKNDIGLDVQIISGNEEAKLSYLGASSSIPNLNEKVVIDIGGGSTEIIYGNSKEIIFKKSFQTGVVSLTEKFLNNFPYSHIALKNTDDYLHNLFFEIKEYIPMELPIIAVAGTPTTLSCIKQDLKDYVEEKVEGSQLEKKDLISLKEMLIKFNGSEIKKKFGPVVYGREDVLFSGLLILTNIMALTNSPIINVSGRGLRYGNIINYINELK